MSPMSDAEIGVYVTGFEQRCEELIAFCRTAPHEILTTELIVLLTLLGTFRSGDIDKLHRLAGLCHVFSTQVVKEIKADRNERE